MAYTRQWAAVALLILALVGISAVQQLGAAEAGPPSGFGGEGPSGGSVTASWTAALTAAAGLVVQWLLMAALFMEASLLSGRRPDYAAGLHVAIWASVPLGVMATLQIVYMLAGGVIGAPGVSGLVGALPGYGNWPGVARRLTEAAAAQLTLFWVWQLVLAGFGLRYTLRARRGAAVFTVLTWAGLVVLGPVVLGLMGGAR
ncbi:MAG: hypothetical protein Kow0077_13760 [Anaerolineae bacterium]